MYCRSVFLISTIRLIYFTVFSGCCRQLQYTSLSIWSTNTFRAQELSGLHNLRRHIENHRNAHRRRCLQSATLTPWNATVP